MIFGGGYLVKKFYLNSIPITILGFIGSLCSFSLFIVICIYKTNIGEILLSLFLFLTLCFGTALCFYNGIKINKINNEIIITTIKKVRIKFNQVDKVFVSTDGSINHNKYCHIIFLTKSGKDYRVNGYLSIFRNHDVEKTQKIVDQINLEINKI